MYQRVREQWVCVYLRERKRVGPCSIFRLTTSRSTLFGLIFFGCSYRNCDKAEEESVYRNGVKKEEIEQHKKALQRLLACLCWFVNLTGLDVICKFFCRHYCHTTSHSIMTSHSSQLVILVTATQLAILPPHIPWQGGRILLLQISMICVVALPFLI